MSSSLAQYGRLPAKVSKGHYGISRLSGTRWRRPSRRKVQTNRDRFAWCNRYAAGCAPGLDDRWHCRHVQHLSVQADERPGSAHTIYCDVQHFGEARQKALLGYCCGSRKVQLPLAAPAAVSTLFALMLQSTCWVPAGGANLDWQALLTTSRRKRNELRVR